MSKKKTSVSFDADTIRIIAQRADEDHLDKSAYLEQLVHRDDLRRRIIADSAALDAAGYSPSRATQITGAILAARSRNK